ncbi:hypothetical protein ACI3ET_14460 [Ornithinimicrobium sp. LYQ121]|uniref:hypothetical protein n=1 Tax=Ornithinimicrobium sp. LYQ121 TaxID=3378801 RepID=UPI003851839B
MREPSSTGATDLVVAFSFTPYVDTAAVVAAKRVREEGRAVDVVQNDMAPSRAQDPDLGRIADDLVRRRTVLPTPTWFSSWKAVRAFADAGLEQVLRWDAEGPGYERLYSRAHWVPSHVLAARVKAHRPHVRWVAEFSDPLSVHADGRERHAPVEEGPLLDELAANLREAGVGPPGDNLFLWAETLPYALADELLFTNTNQRDLMLSRISDAGLAARAAARAVVRPHPTLPPAYYDLADPPVDLDPGRAHIGYFGNFYANRGLGTVLDALAALPAAQRAQVQLHVHTEQGEKLVTAVAARGLEPQVSVRPFVGYLDFLALCRRMDVLLLTDATTKGAFARNPFLPSKWSDYRGSGRPVWGVVEEGSPLSAQALDHRSPVKHTTAAVQVLAQIVREAGRPSGQRSERPSV